MSPRAAVALLVAPLVSCTSGLSCSFWKSAPEEPPPALAPLPSPETEILSGDELPAEFEDDASPESLLRAVDASLEYFGRLPAEQWVSFGAASCTMAELSANFERLRDRIVRGEPRAEWVRHDFLAFRTEQEALITGYYEPILEGRLRPDERFRFPLYARPDDLIEVRLADFPGGGGTRVHGRVSGGKLEPYFSRAEIEGAGALSRRGLELVWLDDPVARFFLHVQGSGVIRLEDGSALRVGYAASNGRAYTSIGKRLMDGGRLGPGQATAPAIQRWLREHPAEQEATLFANERYVFFRVVEQGPLGSLGVGLTPGRSVAADPSVYPPGLLAWIDTRTPVIGTEGELAGYRPVRRLVVVQDAGAAIIGPGRLDLFVGTGEAAGLEAGHMSETGSLYVFFPRCTPAIGTARPEP